jgi:endogenous inhibitor of DNA gyrase (YacG/DUF329 family)
VPATPNVKGAKGMSSDVRKSAKSPQVARTLRGDCPACGKGVYSDQPRSNENGSYYHEECLSAGKSLNAQSTIMIQNQRSGGSRKPNGPTTPGSEERVHRGDCPACGKGVYSDQPRSNENGSYYHEECLSAGKSLNAQSTIMIQNPSQRSGGSRKPNGPTTPGSGARVHRGDCPACGKGVYSDQPRSNENGSYYHEGCLVATSFLKAPISKTASRPEKHNPAQDKVSPFVKSQAEARASAIVNSLRRDENENADLQALSLSESGKAKEERNEREALKERGQEMEEEEELEQLAAEILKAKQELMRIQAHAPAIASTDRPQKKISLISRESESRKDKRRDKTSRAVPERGRQVTEHETTLHGVEKEKLEIRKRLDAEVTRIKASKKQIEAEARETAEKRRREEQERKEELNEAWEEEVREQLRKRIIEDKMKAGSNIDDVERLVETSEGKAEKSRVEDRGQDNSLLSENAERRELSTQEMDLAQVRNLGHGTSTES